MPGSIKALRLHNLLLGGGLTGAQLEAELAPALAAGAFEASLRQRTVAANLKASPAALLSLAASAIALNAVCRQDLTVLEALLANSAAAAALASSAAAFNAVAASATAMTAVAASATAMTAVAESSTAKMACYNSDAALTAMAGSATAMAALRAAGQYSIKTASENGTTPVALGWAGTYIVLGASRSTSTSRNVTLTTVRAGSAISAVIAIDSTSDTLAQDVNSAVPLSAATNFVLSSPGAGTIYFGALRCDV